MLPLRKERRTAGAESRTVLTRQAGAVRRRPPGRATGAESCTVLTPFGSLPPSTGRTFGSGNRRGRGVGALALACSLLFGACGGGPPAAGGGPQGRDRPAAPPPAGAAETPAGAAETPAGALAQVSGQAPPAAGMLVSIVLLEPHAEIDVPLPDEIPVMDQIGRQFVPGFILVRAGQTIDFMNSEDDLHTVHVKNERGESIFNVATMMGSTYEHTFEVGGEYSVICNTHTEMFADILVVDTPYAVVAGRDGRFALPDVVPGRYTATVLHGPDRTEHEIEIVAGPNEVDLLGA